MGKWEAVSGYYGCFKRKMCKKCGMMVYINIKPQANEIDISGEAVALDCTWIY